MPKGNATRRRLRQLEEQLAGLKAGPAGDSQGGNARVPLHRPTTFDWVCGVCEYYCYPDRDRCPRCNASKGQGHFRQGYRRRLYIGQQGQGRTSMAAEARHQQQQQQQLQQPKPQHTQMRSAPSSSAQNVAPLPQQQQTRSYTDAAKAGAANGATRNGTTTAPTTAGQTAAMAALGIRVPGLQPSQAPTVGVGTGQAVQLVRNVAPQARAVQPELHEIHSDANQGDQQGNEYDEPEDAIVEELDPSFTDTIKVGNRMQAVARGVRRRTNRLEKAQRECELQRQSLEQARQMLQAKEEAVAEADSQLGFLKEVHADLARRYTMLTEAAALQASEAKQKETQQSQYQSAARVVWNAASDLRGLGEDPRIEAALYAMESLFNELAGSMPKQVTTQPQAPAATPLTQAQPSAQVVAPATPPPAAPAAPEISPPAAPAICQQCWSIVCRCRSRFVGNADSTTDIEVDLERGKKRSSLEADLPQRVKGGQQSSQAILVDSCGRSAGSDTTQEQMQGVAAGQGVVTPAKASNEVEPQSRAVEPVPAAAASELAVDGNSKPAEQSAPTAAAAGDQIVIEEGEREESRSSFAALVKTTCSQRVCPY